MVASPISGLVRYAPRPAGGVNISEAGLRGRWHLQAWAPGESFVDLGEGIAQSLRADCLVLARVLIPYGTTEGQTAKIAEVIAEVIRDRGHEAVSVDIKSLVDPVFDRYDAVVIGASIHMGKHDKHVVEFVQKNRDSLERLPSAFFSVSLAAYGDTQEAEGYVDHFEEETGWRPDKVAMFGGALLYTHYGFIKRHVMKGIAKDKPGNLGLDTSRDYVYTEWDAVRRFAEQFAKQFESAPA